MERTIRRTLAHMGHPQVATPIKTDNDTANSFVHSTIRVKHSKTWDMRYHWLWDKLAKNILNVFWDRGKNNLADYFTKHHPPAHHRIQRYKHILKGFNLSQLDHLLNKSTFSARVYSSIISKLLTKLLTQKPFTMWKSVTHTKSVISYITVTSQRPKLNLILTL